MKKIGKAKNPAIHSPLLRPPLIEKRREGRTWKPIEYINWRLAGRCEKGKPNTAGGRRAKSSSNCDNLVKRNRFVYP